MALFELNRLTFSYPGSSAPALRDIVLDVEPGEFLLIAGSNGCGKSTLVRHLKSVLTPHGSRSGSVAFDGRPLCDIPETEQARRIAFVAQDPFSQIVTGTVAEEVAFGLENIAVAPETMRIRVAETLGFFDMEDIADASTGTLSGGQTQTLNLAAAVALDPEVLVLDEPISQLDPVTAERFITEITRIRRELGATVVMVEQNLARVFSETDRVAILDEGSLSFIGDPRSAASFLCETGHPLACGLPAAFRMAYAVCPMASGVAVPDCARSRRTAGDVPTGGRHREERRGLGRDVCFPTDGMPLSVREGRRLLARITDEGKNVRIASVAELQAHRSGGDCVPFSGGGVSASEDAPAVKLSHVRFAYGRNLPDVLRDFTLSVGVGEIHALLGGNGSGKSTALKIAAGLLKPQKGRVETESGECDVPLRGSGVAMLPQNPLLLFVHDTVAGDLREMIPDGCRDGAEGDATENDFERVVTFCGIDGILHRHPFDISGGEAKRAALAKVLLARPRILLLDEPTGALDATMARELGRLLRDLREHGMTVLMTSHDTEFCAEFADRCSLLFQGGVAATGDTRGFFSHQHFYTTPAARITRRIFDDAVTVEDAVSLLKANGLSGSGGDMEVGDVSADLETCGCAEKEEA